mmetsp:Transcript_5657/g.20272  ORF Transcript_5657/g.20272 Transcript_5657/m.20272 type:complete len:299 (-) Transcript_5657:225-1121(-)
MGCRSGSPIARTKRQREPSVENTRSSDAAGSVASLRCAVSSSRISWPAVPRWPRLLPVTGSVAPSTPGACGRSPPKKPSPLTTRMKPACRRGTGMCTCVCASNVTSASRMAPRVCARPREPSSAPAMSRAVARPVRASRSSDGTSPALMTSERACSPLCSPGVLITMCTPLARGVGTCCLLSTPAPAWSHRTSPGPSVAATPLSAASATLPPSTSSTDSTPAIGRVTAPGDEGDVGGPPAASKVSASTNGSMRRTVAPSPSARHATAPLPPANAEPHLMQAYPAATRRTCPLDDTVWS